MGWKASSLLVTIAVLAALVSTNGDALNKSCADSSGNIVPHGQTFMPDINDPCHKCKCDNSFPILCHTAACSPPPGCVRIEPIPKECCQYHCYDADGNNLKHPDKNVSTVDDGTNTASEDSITNLSLRLVASTVTSFLVLALLLFMVHRLRQRRLMLAMRRFEAHARQHHGNDDVDPYIPAAFLQIECPPYEDPPPPYSPPKPPHILAEDSPPPYQEIEAESSSTDQLPLDSNANIFNNNNNNDNSCGTHGGGENGPALDFEGTGHGDLAWGSHLEERRCETVDSMQGYTCAQNLTLPGDFPFFSVAASVEGGGGNSDLSSLSLLDVKHSPTSGLDSANLVSPGQEPTVAGAVTAGHARPWSAADIGSMARNGVHQPGRSCSFSYAGCADQDPCAVVPTNPMSHSCHTPMMDSGVQTRGSYMASLSRRRSKPGTKEPSRQATCEDSKPVGVQRMITRPSLCGDNIVQQSHRLLQEELRQSLAPIHAGAGEDTPCAIPTGHRSLAGCSQEPGATADIFIPRSQSLNSNFSVCSETGEKRVPPCPEEGGVSVLQSDSKYPEHASPRHHLANISLVDLDRLNNACGRGFQSDFPYRNFGHQSDTATSVDSCAATKADSSYSARSKMPVSSRQNSRKPVGHPPSQELRPNQVNSRTLPSKIKHKKLSLVPLEKSRLSKSKKEKNKSRKKGSLDLQGHEHKEKPAQTGAENTETTEGWALQGRASDAAKGRHLPLLSPPVIKQYGFLENLPHSASVQVVEDDFAESRRYSEYVGDPWCSGNALAHPYHTLPSQTRFHNTLAVSQLAGLRHLPLLEENGMQHGANSQHQKIRLRPLSAGPTVEAAYDPVPGLSQHCIPRRKVKSIRSKKIRQSYPAVEGDQSADRRMVACMDLNFVEPNQISDRAPVMDCETAGHGLMLKRQMGDRSTSRTVHEYSDMPETHISSYV